LLAFVFFILKKKKTKQLISGKSMLEITFSFHENEFHGRLAGSGVGSGSTFEVLSG